LGARAKKCVPFATWGGLTWPTRIIPPVRDPKELGSDDESGSSESEESDSAEEDVNDDLELDIIKALRISLDPVLKLAPVQQRARRSTRGAPVVQIEETPAIKRLLTETTLRDHKYNQLLEDWADCRALTNKSKPTPKAVADMFDNAQQWAVRVISQRRLA
jgi:hypothetical protein